MTDATKKNRHDAIEFLTELAALFTKFDAEIEYTNDDDGIHISIAGQEVYVGHLLSPAEDLIDAAKKIKEAKS